MRHPILDVLAEQGRSTAWLARRVGRNGNYLTQVFNGHAPAARALRAACAEVLGLPEGDLFVTAPRPYPPPEEVAIREIA